MNLETLESKEALIQSFFNWLFDDKRILDKTVVLDKEIDVSLATYYKDPYIYYPKQFSNLFNTSAMKRLGRILHLSFVNAMYPTACHNRLEHCKGVYYRKLEEMLYNFQKPDWRKKIEDDNLKLFVLADLIKMAGHDIGHLPLSHALEEQLYSSHGAHEVLGKRIMLEDSEIMQFLTSISPNLHGALKYLYEHKVSNFTEHDESNYDVDRLDYLSRDSLYIGKPIHLKYQPYETVSVDADSLGRPKINSDNSIATSQNSNSHIDVYKNTSLQSIEQFLYLREEAYKKLYNALITSGLESSIGVFIKAFMSSESECGKEFRNFINAMTNKDLDSVNLSEYLKWDDIKLYSEVFDIAQHHHDLNVRQLATITIPTMKVFLNVLYSHLHLYDKNTVCSDEDRAIINVVKNCISGNDDFSKNVKNPNFALSNIIYFPSNSSVSESLENAISKGLITQVKYFLKAYNSNNPIYVEGRDKKIYDLKSHPDRSCDWAKRISPIEYKFAYIPYLRFKNLSENEIEELRKVGFTIPSSSDTIFSDSQIEVKPLQTVHTTENSFLEF